MRGASAPCMGCWSASYLARRVPGVRQFFANDLARIAHEVGLLPIDGQGFVVLYAHALQEFGVGPGLRGGQDDGNDGVRLKVMGNCYAAAAQYWLHSLLARLTRSASICSALAAVHQAPGSLSRFWTRYRCALSISPEPMGKPCSSAP